MHGAPVTVQVTSPTSRLLSLSIRVVVTRPLMSSADAALTDKRIPIATTQTGAHTLLARIAHVLSEWADERNWGDERGSYTPFLGWIERLSWSRHSSGLFRSLARGAAGAGCSGEDWVDVVVFAVAGEEALDGLGFGVEVLDDGEELR